MSSVEELGEEIACLSAHLDAATHRLLACIRQFDEQCGWAEQGAVSCAHWLAWRIGLDATTAREKVRVARALGALPAIDEALRVGKLSYAKVRALTRVATPESEAQLLELALHATGAQLERMCRGYRCARAADDGPSPEDRCVRKRLLPGGMVKIEMVLSPDEADLVMRAIDRAREVDGEARLQGPAQGQRQLLHADSDAALDVPWDTAMDAAPDASAEAPEPNTAAVRGRQPGDGGGDDSGDDDCDGSDGSAWPSRADGVVTLAEAFLAGSTARASGSDRYQVMIHVEPDMLGPDGTLSATLEDDTRVSAEALRRVACDSGLVAVGGHGERLDVGRKTRAIPPAIRRMLLVRDRGCAFPGCTRSRFLHAHHIRHWLHGGSTRMDNLVLLCTAHHHRVHEGGWTVARTDAGGLAFTSPAGEALPAEPTRDRRDRIDDALAWLDEWAKDRGLDLGPDANEPLWDGTRPDYDHAVSAMLAAGEPL